MWLETAEHPAPPDVLAALRRYWGFDRLRPFQSAAIDAGLRQQDSLLVLPTGGGKSLCYQLPALIAGRLDVVVSPLIALMKDQVDGLRAAGYPAAALHSGMERGESARALEALERGEIRLLFLAPERLLTEFMLERLVRVGVRAFAIDEAHCISHWGHDFRPEYRQLQGLRSRFPQASLHAFTATATQRVRDDIVAQLGLRQPRILVGSFDRPNLVYRVLPRAERLPQISEILERHRDQAVIVYCMTRRETEELAAGLAGRGFRALHYHAGMNPADRRDTQERFARESVDVIVATVAFGMGIDRSDVRCVIHAALPKSIEHYQQETGRAGRDGLEAECVLLYSPGDVQRWSALLRGDSAAGAAPAILAHQLALLGDMSRYAAVRRCRHRTLVEYFGQPYEPASCGACDVCLGEAPAGTDQTILAQKILSCVARVQERFGAGHVADVLRGVGSQRIRALGHDRLSTFGLLRDLDRRELLFYIHGLIELGLLERTGDEFPVLRLNPASWAVLRGAERVALPAPRRARIQTAAVERAAWADVDPTLFQELRALRRTLAAERDVPAYLILSDATLRELARRRPTSLPELVSVRGIGEAKAAAFGQRLIEHIRGFGGGPGRATEPPAQHRPGHPSSPEPPGPDELPDQAEPFDPAVLAASARLNVRPSRVRRAFELFDQGVALADAALELRRSEGTLLTYLLEWIDSRRPAHLSPWVSAAEEAAIAAASDEVGPVAGVVYSRLNGQAPFAHVRLVLRRLAATQPQRS